MPNIEEEMLERLVAVEKNVAWLMERVWNGTGNHHERIHVLEDKNGDRLHEITKLQGDMARVERVLGLNGYGDKNIVNDLRSAVETINKIKDGIISRQDFQKVLADIIKIQHQLEDLQDVDIAQLAKNVEELNEWQDKIDARAWQIWAAIILLLAGSVLNLVLK